jgi:hypothetical protein
MAKSLTVRKKKTVRAARRVNGFALMPTDSWFKAKHFVHYEIESKDWLTKIKDYIRNNFDKKVTANVYRLPDWKIGNYSHWATTAAMLEKNPDVVPEDYKTGIVKWVHNLAEEGKNLAEEKKAEEKAKPKNVYTPTIQERITEQSQEACEAIEEWLDGFIKDKTTFDPKGFDFTAHFSNMKVSQAHARKIKAYYTREYEEALLIQKLPTPGEINRIKDEREQDLAHQLREGYSHLKKADAKMYLDALEHLMGACDLVIDASKATRKPKAKKAPSKEKLISKLKFKDRDDKLQIVSVNPLEMLDSTEIWIYNVKTRKLGKYVADEYTKTMTVKGNTIVGFDETKSVQKTVRKPEEMLKAFKAAGKVKLRTFLNDINTTEVKLNGRFNTDTVILKVS